MPQLPMAVVDLDGVLADVRHRLRFVNGRHRDWDAFFAAAGDDGVLPEGRAVVDRLATDHEVLYLTGRPERIRSVTEDWLARHRLPRGRLVMRPDGDRRPARRLKPQLLRTVARDRVVAVVVDDDVEVCAALQASGWPVLQADWMPADGSLQVAQESDGRT